MSGTMWEFQKKQVPIVLKWNGFQGLIIGGTNLILGCVTKCGPSIAFQTRVPLFLFRITHHTCMVWVGLTWFPNITSSTVSILNHISHAWFQNFPQFCCYIIFYITCMVYTYWYIKYGLILIGFTEVLILFVVLTSREYYIIESDTIIKSRTFPISLLFISIT